MGFQLWLADVLRDAGLPVKEVAGWRTRSASEDSDASTFSPRGVIIHETRGSATSTDAGEIDVLVNGRVGLSGPIAQLYLSRTGVFHVVAAGLCHHVKTGWGGPFSGWGNTRLLGIEPAHSATEDWSRKPIQYDAYVRGVAAITEARDWPPPVGHREHQPGDKPDPEFSMTRFRADVARVAAGGSTDVSLTTEQAAQLARVEDFVTQLRNHVLLMSLTSEKVPRNAFAYWLRGIAEGTVPTIRKRADGTDEYDWDNRVPSPHALGLRQLGDLVAAVDARDAARDAALGEALKAVAASVGDPLSSEQFAQLVETVRSVGTAAGEAAVTRLQEKLAEAARAEAVALGGDGGDPPTG